MIMISVTGVVLVLWNRNMVARQMEETNAAAAQHGLLIQDGVNKFINDNRLLFITTASPAIEGFATPLEPTLLELQASPAANPYLPAGYNIANQLGMTYTVTLSRLPTGCTPSVNCTDVTGMVSTTAALVDPTTGTADTARVGNLAKKIGLDAAFSAVGSGTLLGGAAGDWTETNPRGNVPGILAMRVGYGSVSYNNLDFLLPRDGSRPMTGNLAMGGNNITGLANLNATGNLATTAGNITTTTGNVVTTSGSLTATNGAVNADFLVPDAQVVGNACASNGAVASNATGVVLVCRDGFWRVSSGNVAVAGGVCSPNGSLATSTATEEALICRGGLYMSLENAVGKYVEISRQSVTDGSVVTKPTCDVGGTATFRFGMVQTAVDVSTTPPKQVTLLTATSGASSWTVSYKLKTDDGTLSSANSYSLSAIMYLECKYP